MGTLESGAPPLYHCWKHSGRDAEKGNLAAHGEPRITKGLPDPGEMYQDTIAALDEYFRPRINPIFEIHQFMHVKQRENETIDSFVSRLQ